MANFLSIDEIHEILDKIAEEIPEELYEKLNQGIILLPEHKTHPESGDTDRLYIMGEYVRSMAGRHIAIYYGSFKEVYSGYSTDIIEEKLRETLHHEFIHHLESLAGERDLEIEDAINLAKYKGKL